VVVVVDVAVLNTSLCADRYLKLMQFDRSSDILLVISCYKVRM
jgi:hypothetical protein